MCLCDQKLNKFKTSVENGQSALDVLHDNNMDEDELKTKIYVRMIKSYMALNNPRQAVEVGDRGIADVRDGAPIQKELVKAR